MRIFITLCFLFWTGTAQAGVSVCLNQNNHVTKYALRGNPLDGCQYYDAGQNVSTEEMERIKTLLKTVPMKHIVYAGFLREMTQAEKDVVNTAIALAVKQEQAAQVDILDVSAKDVVEALVQVINKRLPAGQKITKEEIIQQIKDNKGL